MVAHSRDWQTTKRFVSPLEKLQEQFGDTMIKVDQTIDRYLISPVPMVSTVAKHLIQAGGKRLRPLLTLASNRLFGPLRGEALYLAAAVEFIHTATLLHDDVIDVSDLRRGLKTANSLWGNPTSILVGDFLFAQAFNLMVKCQNLDVLQILSTASAKIAEGEVLQLSLSHDMAISQEDHLKIIGAKTAELFAAACQAGAATANATSQENQCLYYYGYYLGIAFQLTDDILDYTGETFAIGKEKGDDFKAGKITLPVIFALQKATPDEFIFWKKTLLSPAQTSDDINTAITLIHKHKGFDQAYALATTYSKKAISCLDTIPPSLYKEMLIDIATYCVHRNL